jgi:pimeloyl-ACP methyl ester carboxylesterase
MCSIKFRNFSEDLVGLKTYILLHGAWHGAWCWNKVVPALQKLGHTVFAPDLPGHGQDNTPLSSVTLKTYLDSVLALIDSQKSSVVLIGHSMSGIVISQIAELVPDKIEKLIYLSGFVPSNNGNLVQEESQAKSPSVAQEIFIDNERQEISLKVSGLIKDYFYNTCTDQDAAWAILNLQKQPLRPFMDPVSLSDGKFGKVSKLYIECLRDQAIKIEDQRRMHSKLNCEVVSIDTDHSPFISSPSILVQALSAVSGLSDFYFR